MTLELLPTKKKKRLVITPLSNEQVQLDWIKGLAEQIEWANNPDVLPDHILKLKIGKRRLNP